MQLHRRVLIPIVKLLLKHGANINCKTEDEQKTPLIAATEGTSLTKYAKFTSVTTDENQIAVIKLLLEGVQMLMQKQMKVEMHSWQLLMLVV
ncbi:hypothetical protein [Fischerella sp. JS2]|uniref:hypothetical protein n=1 Tax=Fischerella sp. JS2 TaxID=2597771 RepID=UPI0037BE55A2